ncbi:MAG: T9SS type A sorting domain-containing protein [Flavobacteriaceae bacterium]
MKKILLLLAVVLTVGTLYSQTINTTYSWPDATWSLSGTYNVGNLLLDPTTTDSQFKFDDSQVSNSGDQIYLEAPTIDLTAAFTAGEKALKINVSMAFALTGATSEILGFQYWDADARAWVLMPEGTPQAGDSQGDYTTCAIGVFDMYFDFKNLTPNQQQNFKYRVFYDDGGLLKGKGICFTANNITSVNITCNAPTALHTTNLLKDSADISWTANNSEEQWDYEYGGAGFTQGTGIFDQTGLDPSNPGNPPNAHLSALSSSTSYDFYTRANCIPEMQGGAVYSAWSSKLNFTTLDACTAPSGGMGNNIKPTSFNINWAPQGPESSWNIEYGLTGYTQGGSASLGNFVSTDNTGGDLINGLTASTSYDFYVQAICSSSSTSSWAGPYTVTTAAYSLGWYNLQWPQNGSINAGDTYDVYAQVYSEQKTDVSGQTAAATDIKVWIGWSATDTNPNTWPESNWIQTTFNTASLSANNDEYMLNLGATLTTAGTYYYASRFQLFTEAVVYGGFGGPWSGISTASGANVSGVLTVTGTLAVGNQVIEGFNFYPNPLKDNMTLNAQENIEQVELYNLLGQQVMIKQPNVSTYQINMSTLKTGVYFMKVKVGDKTGTYKVVKQ